VGEKKTATGKLVALFYELICVDSAFKEDCRIS
jgi:hypothetical protein